MPRAALTVAEVFRRYGDTFRAEVGAALSTAHSRVMTAIEQCRTAALGGHVEQCDQRGHRRVWYNSCRNRHCPTCQSLARAAWLERRREDLLPTEYFHVVFTVPPPVAEIAAQNKAVVYGLLFRAVAETLRTIAADPRHLGADIGFFAVLHTWGQTLVHHPHLHCVIPGGGAGEQRQRLGCLPPRVLSAGPGPVTLLPSSAPRGAAGRLRVRRAALRRPAADPQRPPALRRAPPAGPRDRMGGLREATLRRPRTGPRLPRPLHPPDRHQQPAPVQPPRRLRALPLHRLPPDWRVP